MRLFVFICLILVVCVVLSGPIGLYGRCCSSELYLLEQIIVWFWFLPPWLYTQSNDEFPCEKVIKIKLFCLCPCRENLLLWQGLCSEALLLHTQWNSLHEWMYICSIVQSFFNISVKLILPWCWKRYLLRTQCWIVHHLVLYCQLKNWHTPGDGSFLQRWIQ